jgi:hypothetical protein
MDLLEMSKLRAKLKNLEAEAEGVADFLKKLELKDEILELRQKIGEWKPPQKGEDCESCSG